MTFLGFSASAFEWLTISGWLTCESVNGTGGFSTCDASAAGKGGCGSDGCGFFDDEGRRGCQTTLSVNSSASTLLAAEENDVSWNKAFVVHYSCLFAEQQAPFAEVAKSQLSCRYAWRAPCVHVTAEIEWQCNEHMIWTWDFVLPQMQVAVPSYVVFPPEFRKAFAPKFKMQSF